MKTIYLKDISCVCKGAGLIQHITNDDNTHTVKCDKCAMTMTDNDFKEALLKYIKHCGINGRYGRMGI